MPIPMPMLMLGLSLLLTGTLAADTKPPLALSVTSLEVKRWANPSAIDYFKLSPDGCSSKNSKGIKGSKGNSKGGNRSNGSTGADGGRSNGQKGTTAGTKKMASPAAEAVPCTGFSLSSVANFSSNTNTASFAPNTSSIVLTPGATLQRGIGMVLLQNNGLMHPQDAAMPLITVQGRAHIKSQDGRKLAALPFAFNVSWSLGGASPANMAGMFLLSEPGKTFSLKPVAPRGKSLQGSNVTALPMVKLTIQGFLPAAGTAAGAVIVRGDWGQPAPPAGVPGPQVSIKQGAPQKVQLIAKITTA